MTPNDLQGQLIKYLSDAHSIEGQALVQMKAAPGMAGDPVIARAFEQHATETEEHERLVDERLNALGASPSKVKDAAFSYAFEHLEIAAYELLRRMAGHAGDSQTQAIADAILGEERAAADKIHRAFDSALDASLGHLAGTHREAP
jgi:ferritin-like metal-binding protein YciE